MSSLARSFPVSRAALAAALGLVAMGVTAMPAHADAWIQFGVVGVAPPPVVVAPSPLPPPAYGYVYSYPYAYAYPSPYYAVPSYGYAAPFNAYGRYHWHHRHWRDRDDWDGD
jgi:hypothetical protein